MARVVPLCSSSKANSAYFGERDEGVLIDVGCSFRALKNNLNICGIDFEAVKAVCITHEHSDHIAGLLQLTKNTDIPVYASRGTLDYIIRNGCVERTENLYDISELPNAPVNMEIKAFRTSHDSAESVGYVINSGGDKLAYCTDLGEVTETVRRNVDGSRLVYLESNYDMDMLKRNTKYPPFLKSRIASDRGHLSNEASADYACELIRSGTTHFVLAHLSKENNTPEIARNNAVYRLQRAGMRESIDYEISVAPVSTEGRYISL